MARKNMDPQDLVEPDVMGIIMSYLSDDALESLYVSSAAPSLTSAYQDNIFWHARVETLSGRRVEYSAAVDWKQTYRILNRELQKNRPSFYNEEDNVIVLKILLSMNYVPSSDQISSAAGGGQTKILQFLLDEGSLDPNEPIDDGYYPPLTLAAENGQSECVRILLSDPRVDPNNEGNGQTIALVKACYAEDRDRYKEYVEIVSLLLKDGRADPRWNESNALYASSSNGDNHEIVALLLQDGRANPMDDDGESFIQAVWDGRLKIVTLFLKDKRTRPWIRDGAGLIIACSKGHYYIVSLLIRDGRIDPNSQDGAALVSAIRQDINELGYLLIIELLLADDRTYAAINDNAALNAAIEVGNAEVVDLLLKNNDVLLELSETSLALAEQEGSPEIIELVRSALESK